MTSQEEQDLEQTYGPAAPFSDHKRGDHITYTSAEGPPGAGVILWVCAAGMVGNEHMGVRYIVAPDVPMGMPDIVWPADILTHENSQTQEPQEETLSHCPYYFGRHPIHLVEACPLNPKNR